jgi:hypothetical protein
LHNNALCDLRRSAVVLEQKTVMRRVCDQRFVGMLVAEPGTRSIKTWQENITIGIRLLDCELD